MKAKQKRWDGQSFLIGRYQLGWRMVNLYAEPSDQGGWFNLCRNREDAQIHVGMDYAHCDSAFAVLCHEVWEMCMDDLSAKFKPQAFCEGASDLPRFFFDHNQHTEICARSSYFIYGCFKDFQGAFLTCWKHKRDKARLGKRRKPRKRRQRA